MYSLRNGLSRSSKRVARHEPVVSFTKVFGRLGCVDRGVVSIDDLKIVHDYPAAVGRHLDDVVPSGQAGDVGDTNGVVTIGCGLFCINNIAIHRYFRPADLVYAPVDSY